MHSIQEKGHSYETAIPAIILVSNLMFVPGIVVAIITFQKIQSGLGFYNNGFECALDTEILAYQEKVMYLAEFTHR